MLKDTIEENKIIKDVALITDLKTLCWDIAYGSDSVEALEDVLEQLEALIFHTIWDGLHCRGKEFEWGLVGEPEEESGKHLKKLYDMEDVLRKRMNLKRKMEDEDSLIF